MLVEQCKRSLQTLGYIGLDLRVLPFSIQQTQTKALANGKGSLLSPNSKIKVPYLRSRKRRGRWFHTYRRDGVERSLGVHGLDPEDPRVLAAWAAEHSRWQERPPQTETPADGTFAWAVDLYLSGNKKWQNYSEDTRKSRMRILLNYCETQGERPISTISTEDLELALYTKGGHAAVNELKALKPVFAHAKKMRFIPFDPAKNVEIDKPDTVGFPEATAEDIEKYQRHWPIGTTERLVLDLAMYTGAARQDLARLNRKNVVGDVLTYSRGKTGVEAHIPMTLELRQLISRTPEISPAFILNQDGRPYTKESLGNFFQEAAKAAGMTARLHGMRKAFCIFWAERGVSTHQIAAMAGHITLSEVERYTRAADRKRMVQLLIQRA